MIAIDIIYKVLPMHMLYATLEVDAVVLHITPLLILQSCDAVYEHTLERNDAVVIWFCVKMSISTVFSN